MEVMQLTCDDEQLRIVQSEEKLGAFFCEAEVAWGDPEAPKQNNRGQRRRLRGLATEDCKEHATLLQQLALTGSLLQSKTEPRKWRNCGDHLTLLLYLKRLDRRQLEDSLYGGLRPCSSGLYSYRFPLSEPLLRYGTVVQARSGL